MSTSVCEIKPTETNAGEIKPTETKTPPAELATIFRSLGSDFIEAAKLGPRQTQAFRNIVECRTAAKGGHTWRCSSCSLIVPQYNSCLDRHCPKCQGKARFKWVADRMKDVVNTSYFHVVFTLPHELNLLISLYPKLTLDLLFKAVSQTLLAFGRDPKHLGGELGMITILHTWTQKLDLHYHLHCIIPGGALSNDGTHWIPCKYESYLFPEFALAKTFRRLYWHGSKDLTQGKPGTENKIPVKFRGLKDLLLEAALEIPLSQRANLEEYVQTLEDRLYKKPWVVYAKRAFGGPAQVIKYLGNYTHRVAISNNRIVSHVNGMVTISYKDRKNENRRRTLSLPEKVFASRFLQHVLPTRFMKIRSYGFLANRKKKKRVQQIHSILGQPDLSECQVQAPAEAEESGSSNKICPECKKPTLEYKRPISKLVRRWVQILIWDSS